MLCFMLHINNLSVRAQTQLPVTPLPATAVQGAGNLLVDHGLQVVFEGYTEPRLERARTRFFDTLSRETGILEIPAPPFKEEKFVIKGGYIDGQALDKKGVEALSALPSRDEMRATFLATLLAVPQNFLRLTTAAQQSLLLVLAARERALGTGEKTE